MKRGNLSKWADINTCINLLFFSQLVNELLFDYSIPSNRISTLNSHFLCYDARNAIRSIERHGVPEGTLKPIIEELFVALDKDPAFDTSNKPTKYFVKYQNDKPRICSSISELNFDEMKKATEAIHTHFFKENQYYNQLKQKIVGLVVNNNETDQRNLFRLVKSLLTELINSGYSIKYIQNVMTLLFWNPQQPIQNPNTIECFFDFFDFTKKEFTVVFVVNKQKTERFVKHIDSLVLIDSYSPKTSRKAEKNFLDKDNNQAFLQIKCTAYDRYKAAEHAKYIYFAYSALYRLSDHNYRYDITGAKCGVYDNTDFYLVDQELSGTSHTKTPSANQIRESIAFSQKALNSLEERSKTSDSASLIHAAQFHARSLDSSSSENQLLDLWAIFESILNISNKHTSDRIHQVCMYLIPILKRKYIYSLFLQLSEDIKVYSQVEYDKITGLASTEADVVQCIFDFVVLEDHKAERDKFLQTCADFPLMKERISYYEEVLSTPTKIYSFVEKHADRVRWQVMRIYRNRNLIIHNGKSMPYLDLLIENLHSYVDDFLNYVIHSVSEGHDFNSMYQALFVKECEWLEDFSRNKNKLDEKITKKVLAL